MDRQEDRADILIADWLTVTSRAVNTPYPTLHKLASPLFLSKVSSSLFGPSLLVQFNSGAIVGTGRAES